MIVGIGTDLVDIRRIAKTLERHSERFMQRVFTPVEIARCERRPLLRVASYAKRFAAKEACSKALGTGLRGGVHWRAMGVINLPSGKPTLALTDGAAERLARLTPAGHVAAIDLALSDDFPWAQAFVVISLVPIAKDIVLPQS
ncbi:MAG: holo-ACP synthase [Hyphomicrobiales bacterium]|nr:holo-ACP synthase [Hyphomicrobiales bacterium]OQW81040.1 MAG: holo-ACP synthase [Proteobacteria bacterium ST_bin15]